MSDQGYEQFPTSGGDQTAGAGQGTDGEAVGGPVPANPDLNQSLPGPHPHEASDIKYQAGDVASSPDPMAGYRDEAT